MVLMAVVGLIATSAARTSKVTASPVAADSLSDVDLSAEARIVNTFVKDVFTFDKRAFELNKRTALTHEEFNSLKHDSDELKNRISAVQTALQGAITKLKAGGQWDDLDATLLARVTNAKARSLFQQKSFKLELEEAASNLSGNADELALPLDRLRLKVSGLQEPRFERG